MLDKQLVDKVMGQNYILLNGIPYKKKKGAEIRQISPVSDTEGFKWEYEEGYDQTSIDAEQNRIKVYDDSVKVDTVTLVTVILLVQILPLIFQIQR